MNIQGPKARKVASIAAGVVGVILVAGQACSRFAVDSASVSSAGSGMGQSGSGGSPVPGQPGNATPGGGGASSGSPTTPFTPTVEKLNFGAGVVNSTAFWQDPKDDTLLFGRMRVGDQEVYQLHTFRLDAVNKILQPLSPVVPAQFQTADGRTVTTTYDPTIILVGQERVLAFECVGPRGFVGTAAVCVGPVDASNQLITSRTVAIVDGVSTEPGEAQLFSASQPKMVVDGNQIYLFWTQVRISKTTGDFEVLKTWGAPIAKAADGYYRVQGAAGPVASDSPLAKLVWGINEPPMADLSQIVPYGNAWLLAGHGGDASCGLPLPLRPTCYYMKLGWVAKGLGQGRFDQIANLTGLPDAAEKHLIQYPRFIRDPRGGVSLIFNEINEPTMTLWRLKIDEPAAPPAAVAPVPTAGQNMFSDIYKLTLNRAPDAASLREAATYSCYRLGRVVAQSPEAYASRYDALDNVAFVGLIYRTLLAREADAAGLNAWAVALRSAQLTRVQLIERILNEPEYRARCKAAGLS